MKVQATSPPSTFKVGNCRMVSHERKVWRHVEANLVRRTGLDKEETEVTAGRHLIVLNVKGRSERGEGVGKWRLYRRLPFNFGRAELRDRCVLPNDVAHTSPAIARSLL